MVGRGFEHCGRVVKRVSLVVREAEDLGVDPMFAVAAEVVQGPVHVGLESTDRLRGFHVDPVCLVVRRICSTDGEIVSEAATGDRCTVRGLTGLRLPGEQRLRRICRQASRRHALTIRLVGRSRIGQSVRVGATVVARPRGHYRAR